MTGNLCESVISSLLCINSQHLMFLFRLFIVDIFEHFTPMHAHAMHIFILLCISLA